MTTPRITRSGTSGPGAVTLRIGGISVAVSSDDPDLTLRVPETARSFLVSGADADASVIAGWGDLAAPVQGDKIFDSGLLWQLYRQDAAYVFRFASPVFGAIPYKQASFDSDFTSGRVVLHREYFRRGDAVDPLEYPLDELLTMHLLAEGRGVEVHGCGVADSDGRGYLFLGQSGAGKSTLARLWARGTGPDILSDDRIILRMLDGRLWMYGTPWHGEAGLASARRTPVEKVFFLARGARNEIAPLSERRCGCAPDGLQFRAVPQPVRAGFHARVPGAGDQERALRRVPFRARRAGRGLHPGARGVTARRSDLCVDLASELLGRERRVRFRAPGASMAPAIEDGDAITVEPVRPEDVRTGDIVLYRAGRRVIAHRVVGIESESGSAQMFMLRGDAGGSAHERVEPRQILGRVSTVERKSWGARVLRSVRAGAGCLARRVDFVWRGTVSDMFKDSLPRSMALCLLAVLALPVLARTGAAVEGPQTPALKLAAPRAAAPTLTSDKPDYHPGERVTLTGGGWAPHEAVTIVMTVVPATHGSVTLTSIADRKGRFANSDYVVQQSDSGVTFHVTATGMSSGLTALTTFTDTGNVTVATGGSAISADATGGTYTTLTGPVISETNGAGMSLGSIILTAPSGFQFDTTANSVTVTVGGSGGTGGVNAYINTINSTTGDTNTSLLVTPTSTTITIWVTVASTQSFGTRLSTFTWSGIKVRPTAGTPLASGNITYGGTSTGVTGGTNMGTLTEVVGAVNASHSTISPATATTWADGTSTYVISVRARDQFDNNRATGGSTVLMSKSGGGTLSGVTDNGNGTYTATLTSPASTGSATITATLVAYRSARRLARRAPW